MILIETRELFNTTAVSIAGVDINCKGRNGWFKHHITGLIIDEYGDCFLNIGSKRIGKRYPLCMVGNADVMIEYFEAITKQLKYLKTCKEET